MKIDLTINRNDNIRELRKRGYKLRVIGKVYNLTRERIRQICLSNDKYDEKGKFIKFPEKFCIKYDNQLKTLLTRY